MTEERDNYKYSMSNHYTTNTWDFKPPLINKKEKEVVQLKSETEEICILDNYMTTGPQISSNLSSISLSNENTPIKNIEHISKINKDSSVDNTPTKASFMGYIKNIFKPGK